MKKHLEKLLPIVFLLLLILFPAISIKGAKDGLILWYSTVVPTLLPFIMISNIITKSGAIHYFSYLFYPIYRLFPKLLHCLSYVLVIGFFCGYPMGGKVINDLIADGSLTTEQGQFLLSICNNASPMFIIGYVVIASLKGTVSSLLFLGFIYVPIFLYALGYIILHPHLLIDYSYQNKPQLLHQQSIGTDDSILNAFTIVMKIGAYIMLFSIFSQLLLSLNIASEPLKIITIGFCEVTTGIKYLSELQLVDPQKIALIAAAVSFGGLSSAAQTKSVLTGSRLSIVSYVLSKAIIGVMTYFLVIMYYKIY